MDYATYSFKQKGSVNIVSQIGSTILNGRAEQINRKIVKIHKDAQSYHNFNNLKAAILFSTVIYPCFKRLNNKKQPMTSSKEIHNAIQKEVELIRPPEHIRKELDYSFTFENNILMLVEVRPHWNDKSVMQESPFVKARYYKSRNTWQLYWMRGTLKWELYEPKPEFKTIREDKYCCFFG
jgi:hypothetical protein